jgi:diguanylate cyclase (GGDEF)-like protein/PAS domain S-box-containing protein
MTAKPRNTAFRNMSIALSLGILLTVLSFLLAWTSIYYVAERQFSTEADIVGEHLQQHLVDAGAALDGLITLFLSAPYTDESSFHVVSERLMEQNRFLVSSAYFHRVDESQRAEFEQEMQLHGYAGFGIREATDAGLRPAERRQRYLTLMYVEPTSVRHAMLLGLDIEADPTLRPILYEAIANDATRGIVAHGPLSCCGYYWLFKPLFVDSIGNQRNPNGIVAVGLDLHSLSNHLELPAKIRFSLYEFGKPEHKIGEWGQTDTGLGVHFSLQQDVGDPAHPLLLQIEKRLAFSALHLVPLLLAASAGLLITSLLAYLAHSATVRTHWLMARHDEISRQVESSTLDLESAEAQLELSLRQLREQEEKYRSLIQNTSEGFWMFDTDMNTIDVNDSLCRMLGYRREELLGKSLFDFAEATVRDIFAKRQPHNGNNRHHRYEIRFIRKIGKQIPVILAVTRLCDAQGNPTGAFAFVTDITRRKQMEKDLKLAASVFTHAGEGIMITDADAKILGVNKAFTRITGFERDESIGRNCNILQSGHHTKAFYQEMWGDLLKNGAWEGEIWNRRKNGEVYVETLKISAVTDANHRVQHFVGLFSDITSQKDQLTQLTHIAYYDALTQLPNRLLFFDRLSQAMTLEQRRGLSIVVAYIDLDGFKTVNDTYGHATGDRLLITMSKKMHQALREGDTLARFGGDEFVALIVDIASVAAAYPILERLIAAASEPVTIDEHEICVSASIGFTINLQAKAVDANELLHQADLAMYQAKAEGKNRYKQFEPETHPNQETKSFASR